VLSGFLIVNQEKHFELSSSLFKLFYFNIYFSPKSQMIRRMHVCLHFDLFIFAPPFYIMP